MFFPILQLWGFFYPYEHIAFEHPQQARSSTTQISLAQRSETARADQSATTDLGESQHVVEHQQLAVFLKRTKKSESARSTHIQALYKQLV